LREDEDIEEMEYDYNIEIQYLDYLRGRVKQGSNKSRLYWQPQIEDAEREVRMMRGLLTNKYKRDEKVDWQREGF
jgi:hypothetical protein